MNFPQEPGVKQYKIFKVTSFVQFPDMYRYIDSLNPQDKINFCS